MTDGSADTTTAHEPQFAVASILPIPVTKGRLETTEANTSTADCPDEPFIWQVLCGGYPSAHPHWRYKLEESATPNSGTYSWSGNYFTIHSGSTGTYITGAPTSAGYFTVYCTVTYPCTSGTITYNVSLTDNTANCDVPVDDL